VETGNYPCLGIPLLRKLCRALEIPPNQEAYLINLATPDPPPTVPDVDILTDGARSVVDAASPNPAVIINRRLDILYWNRSAAAMLLDFATLPVEERNVLLTMFRSDELRENWVTWIENARNLVAVFRMLRSTFPHDRGEFDKLVAEL